MHWLLALVCFAAIAAAAESHWPWQREPSETSEISGSSASEAVIGIKRMLLDVERKMQRFCRKYTSSPLEERYGGRFYRLHANLTGCRERSVEVRAGQRLVSVQARDSRCDYIGLKLLPTAVDSNSAFWRYNNGQLTIFFPYETESRRCGRVVSDAIHSLPKFDDGYSDDASLGAGLGSLRYSEGKDGLADLDYN